METYGGIAEKTAAYLFASAGSEWDRLKQLWNITYLESGSYSIQSVYKSDMALHATDGTVDITTIGNSDTQSIIPNENRWNIEYGESGYLFKHEGETGQTLKCKAPFPAASIITAEYSSANASFQWTLESNTAVTNQVLLLDTRTGESVANTTRYVAVGDTAYLEEFEIAAAFVCAYSNDQSITWSTINPSVVSIDPFTGSVTGLLAGESATIVATHIYNGISYQKYYTVHVVEENIPTYKIVHYYDVGYDIRESGAMEAVQSYHNAVASRLESIFGLKVFTAIRACTSLCDECKLDKYGTISSSNLDLLCEHDPVCAETNNMLADLFTQVDMGDSKTSIVLWTGHGMNNPVVDRSSSGEDHSVFITTYGVKDWSDANDKYTEQTFTLLHELSHQLGAHDHYCTKEDSNDTCTNLLCDICINGYSRGRDCIMSRGYDISTLSDEDMYCSTCDLLIARHIEDHHYPLQDD